MSFTPAENVHRQLLEVWRTGLNLVGPGPIAEHFEDAAAAVGWGSFSGRWIDLGSGAGFPGIALAARHPDCQVTLLESRRKRARFLEEVVACATLENATVLCARSETLDPGSWDGVVSRAYRPPPEYLLEASDLVVPGGVVLALIAGQEPIEVPGLQLFHVEPYTLGDRQRSVLAYRRT